MRTLTFALALLFVSLTACNNAGKQNNSSSEDTGMQEINQGNKTGISEENAVPPVPADAKVYFKNLKDGQTVTSPFKVEMGAEGIKVEPAGEVKEGFGHHHILIDAGDSMDKGTVIPTDSSHLHFGKGQTETELTLPSGKHRLTLQFADGSHRSYGSQLSSSITVNVK